MTSKRRLRRECRGKKSYPTHEAAAAELRRHRSDRYGEMYVYRCPFGTHYHIGHRPRWVQAIVERRTAS